MKIAINCFRSNKNDLNDSYDDNIKKKKKELIENEK